jgi:hypothetical protein
MYCYCVLVGLCWRGRGRGEGEGEGGGGQSEIKELTLNHSEMMAQFFFSLSWYRLLSLCGGIFLPLANCPMLGAMSGNF